MAKLSRVPGHKISWFVWAGGEKLPHTAKMRGTWGYDVVCECGWESRTGGATHGYIADQVWFHKLECVAEATGQAYAEIITQG